MDNEEMFESAERLQAINKLLNDYSKSQALIIHDLRNAIIVISVVALAIITLMATAFFLYSSQFEQEEETKVEQQVELGNDNGNTIVNGIGDIKYGAD